MSELFQAGRYVDQMDDIIRDLAKSLKVPAPIDPVVFLQALVGKESSFGRYDYPKYERAYDQGGIYFNVEMDSLHSKYGSDIARSYGAFQVMYATAIWFGFSKDISPCELWSAFDSGVYAVKYLNHQVEKGAKTPEVLYASYNGGYVAKDFKKYNKDVQTNVKNFMKIYNQLLPKPKPTNPQEGKPNG